MKNYKLASYMFALILLLSFSCANNSEEGTGSGQDPEPAIDTGVVETNGGPELCGGIAGLQCSEGQFCDMPAGQCQVADSQGTCVYQPQVCTKEYRPVCGCDGKTYGNDCGRIAAGVSKDYDGECKSGGGY